MSKTGDKKRINIRKVFCKGIKGFLSMLIAAYVILCIVIFTLYKAPQFFGYTIGIVKSGSMEPALHTGSVVYYKETDAESIKNGDIIAYQAGSDLIVVHRVIAISEEEQTFTTKGDNNETEDIAPVPYSSLLGKAEFSIPVAGYLYMGIEKYRILIITSIFLFFCAGILFNIVKRDGNAKNISPVNGKVIMYR